MVPIFKDEERKEEYLTKMYGVLRGIEELVKETRENIQNSINSCNTDDLINAFDHLSSCLFVFDNVSRKIMEDSKESSLYHPNYEERYEMLELLNKAYTDAMCEDGYSQGDLESRRPQKVKYVNKIAESIGMGHGEFRS